MPSTSKAQQKAAGAALSAKRRDTKKSEPQGASKGKYESMSEKQLEDFASTNRKGLPNKVVIVQLAPWVGRGGSSRYAAAGRQCRLLAPAIARTATDRPGQSLEIAGDLGDAAGRGIRVERCIDARDRTSRPADHPYTRRTGMTWIGCRGLADQCGDLSRCMPFAAESTRPPASRAPMPAAAARARSSRRQRSCRHQRAACGGRQHVRQVASSFS